ncbi:hypothetical protein HanXRQr2_Chr04g0185381 [Helianthus annuus]|nr:hypothetical protein HanXRQr2_Chr04g0185381 [Helianthus annuus]KAJ0582407.1 hypothetical protein HanHA300_Chr04g0151911 [Helianthus annuus]KAJ0590635.1 hypothetical protein HanIR_Chr04g0199691 [Helianthus annuus]KAJ0598389.1 hypothetical protein HanHA89_Chr04g0165271 [Helianthus annuus]KAJ0762650.1 hypothetical protein HanOQP8_Chr04g0163701 [Helianthus annuus]
MEMHSTMKGIQLFKTPTYGTSGLYYFHKKKDLAKVKRGPSFMEGLPQK